MTNNPITIGIGAGIVSALLFLSALTGAPLGILLSYIAPLPIIIASLGWDHRAGLLALAIGGFFLSMLAGPYAGMAFTISIAGPAWLLARTLMLQEQKAESTVFIKIGYVVLAVAALAAFVTLFGIYLLGSGSFETYSQRLEIVLQEIQKSSSVLKEGNLPPVFIDYLERFIPFFASLIMTVILGLNLWLASHIVKLSGRFMRPWPSMLEVRLPFKITCGLLALGGILASLAGFPGVFGLAILGSLFVAFSAQGFGLVHIFASQYEAKRGLLLGFYAIFTVFGHILLPLISLIGLADMVLGLRSHIQNKGD